MNDRSDQGLHLTGKQLRSRINTYKKKFTKTKEWAENTGAGIEERNGASTLAEKLERMCPCYECMYGIFAAKHNFTPLRTYDSIDGIGAMVSSRSSGSEDDEGTETDDLTEGPEDILEGQRSLEEPHEGSEEMQDLHDSANQSKNYPTNHHASASGVDVEINLLGNDQLESASGDIGHDSSHSNINGEGMDLTPDSQLSSQSPLPLVSSAKTPSASVPHSRRSNQAQSLASRPDVPPSSGQEESDDGSASRRSLLSQSKTN
ncbi:hypothetical protein PCANC_12344 [Puccinia coronata f. sp. avenae]|uniref:Uncharacterized protein n=1 Tax=Puccinia coronata f. sp. avenae TaxID=200324 RepID=A0A2N5V3U4_9BASI|nr:hypothetical protein PCANC_12344 [Puccinia coronata f. sp. avenae]